MHLTATKTFFLSLIIFSQLFSALSLLCFFVSLPLFGLIHWSMRVSCPSPFSMWSHNARIYLVLLPRIDLRTPKQTGPIQTLLNFAQIHIQHITWTILYTKQRGKYRTRTCILSIIDSTFLSYILFLLFLFGQMCDDTASVFRYDDTATPLTSTIFIAISTKNKIEFCFYK